MTITSRAGTARRTARRPLRLLSVLPAVALLVACTGPEPSAGPTDPAAPTAAPSPAVAAQTPPAAETPAPSWTPPAEFRALWPETAASEVGAELPTWRQSPEQTARAFATAVLGWAAPEVAPADSPFNVGSDVEVYTVARTEDSPRIEVHLRRMVDAEHWSVTYLWGFGKDDHPASVSVRPDEAFVSFGYWGEAASAQLLLRYGEHEIERTSREQARWRVPIDFPLTTPGAVMVLFRDSSGRVFTGWGTALPAGEVAAG